MKIGYQVGDIMTSSPVTVLPSMTLSEAAKVMKESDVNSLLVAQ